MFLKHPLVWFIALCLSVIATVIAFAQTEPLPDVLRRLGEVVYETPCQYQGSVYHCFIVNYNGEPYVVLTTYRNGELRPIFVFTDENGTPKEVWGANHTEV